MMKNLKNSLRPKLTIDTIGTWRFWLGILIGVLYAIVLFLFFYWSREMLRYLTGVFSDLLLFSEAEFRFFDTFLAAFSTAVGFSFTIHFWMSTPRFKSVKLRRSMRLGQVNSSLIIWVPIMLLARIGSLLFLVLFLGFGPEIDLMMMEDFYYLFVMLPLVILLQNWMAISKVFNVRRWILFSIAMFILLTFIISSFFSTNDNDIDSAYLSRFSDEYRYLDDEVARAESLYELNYLPKAIRSLKRWRTNDAKIQLGQVTGAFTVGHAVPLDTIILQKIIIRNAKIGFWAPRKSNTIKGWYYATPMEILEQIKLQKSDATILGELINLLKEQILLLNTAYVDNNDQNDMDINERRRYFVTRNKQEVVNQITEVIKELESMEGIPSMYPEELKSKAVFLEVE